MGTVYKIPKIGELTFSDYDGLISGLSQQQSVAYNTIHNDGLMIITGVTEGSAVNVSRWLCTNGDIYYAFYRLENSNYGFYSFIKNPCVEYFLATYNTNMCNLANSPRNNTRLIGRDTSVGAIYVVNAGIDVFDTKSEAEAAILEYMIVKYPITYHYTNSTVSGPSEAAIGDIVIVSAVPDVGYGITDASTQILVTNDDVAVPYTWDATNQRITFTMSQPVENRGGFGSTGQ